MRRYYFGEKLYSNIQLGLVFSCFMVALMLGSCIFTIAEGQMEVVEILRYTIMTIEILLNICI